MNPPPPPPPLPPLPPIGSLLTLIRGSRNWIFKVTKVDNDNISFIDTNDTEQKVRTEKWSDLIINSFKPALTSGGKKRTKKSKSLKRSKSSKRSKRSKSLKRSKSSKRSKKLKKI